MENKDLKESFILNETTRVRFIACKDAPSGIKKIAGKVAEDVKNVTDSDCQLMEEGPDFIKADALATANKNSLEHADKDSLADIVDIYYGIAGECKFIQELIEIYQIDISGVIGKREVYLFKPLVDEKKIIIIGSDKRGAIYGLFHISDLLGVSPLVNWSNVIPSKKNLEISEDMCHLSKEPSVKYRGFFINDEWPAFGNWCMKNFGGVNCQMYEGVFEMLLRMKGNYLWPAMWASCFAEDGPGLKSAELADELGVVMGLSHHEPCLRHGEEYSHVRGKDSIYGDAWNFRTNREGITRFWRDGLKRNGHLENIITIGMRGERDSKILGEDATLKDNIDLLRDVIKTQNQLIKEEVNEKLDQVPRMLALYKEVEPYYYGNENVEGLKNSEDLRDVILLLCDDNHGYVRSLPDEDMRKHSGGFGMYYHFDYHGDPISYEWINSTYLPEVWEQMTTCYEHGIKDLWIVNVGDLGLQEMPLSYFLSLAYDYDTYGINSPNSTEDYIENWLRLQFGGGFSDKDINELKDMYVKYTRLVHNRRPEHMNDKVYHPQNYYEASLVLKDVLEVERKCKELADKCPDIYKDSFTELITYNVLGGMNLIKLWIYRSFNHYFASIGAGAANKYGDLVRKCLEVDDQLRDELHRAADGKWYGFGLAEHIGFTNWNAEESAYPIIENIIPVRKGEIRVGLMGETASTSGQDWSCKKLYINHYLNVDEDSLKAVFFLALSGDREVEYKVTTSADFVEMKALDSDETNTGVIEKSVSPDNPITFIEVKLKKKDLASNNTAHIYISYEIGNVDIELKPLSTDYYVCDAENYNKEVSDDKHKLLLLKDIGRRESGIKYLPVIENIDYRSGLNYLQYDFNIAEAGDYKLVFQLMPNSPYEFGKKIYVAYSVNSEDINDIKTLQVLSDEYEPGVTDDWKEGVLDHSRLVEGVVSLKAGLNSIRYYAASRENVLERIMVVKESFSLPQSYMGPPENIF
ncbi:MAG: glycosyl hydrolase 115 family protein [Eubacterium sp.]|nr:glycosyl hydrolase 115 family protein [Eubacterium sp.]